jgi:hypothetical protein
MTLGNTSRRLVREADCPVPVVPRAVAAPGTRTVAATGRWRETGRSELRRTLRDAADSLALEMTAAARRLGGGIADEGRPTSSAPISPNAPPRVARPRMRAAASTSGRAGPSADPGHMGNGGATTV